MKRLNKKGFTLVELLAVIVILALLMVVAGNSIANVQDNARKSAIESETKKLINKASEDYQLSLITPTTMYTYSSATAPTAAAQTVTFTDDTYTMIASVTAGKVTAYCIQDNIGAVLSTSVTNYQKTKKCSTASAVVAR